MSIEDEIRRIVNEELDRRAEEARYQLLKSNTQLYEDALRKMRDAPASNWDFNEVAMPEPEVPWQERHDREENPYPVGTINWDRWNYGLRPLTREERHDRKMYVFKTPLEEEGSG